ncbi:hypothetical protein LEP1GSC193_0261 [Leptospira alstonii serovar Pingchang str. 80-412]|uniref:Uncharacterized protein n=2 Tax=Leptospira alstonii TaxID=28452 RepID=M6CPU2_9LEPT|nr:hypothetical protein LEP1GSC194_0070 [Leptospira alstonii serovar Sichuan str. 79601]EQA81779.1 hypothetical protein LEP1GSC193_0261 [Leptospira alstonii serovar Pingchang str. 80-412]
MIHFEHSPALKKIQNVFRKQSSHSLCTRRVPWCWEENFIPYFQKAGYDGYERPRKKIRIKAEAFGGIRSEITFKKF